MQARLKASDDTDGRLNTKTAAFLPKSNPTVQTYLRAKDHLHRKAWEEYGKSLAWLKGTFNKSLLPSFTILPSDRHALSDTTDAIIEDLEKDDTAPLMATSLPLVVDDLTINHDNDS